MATFKGTAITGAFPAKAFTACTDMTSMFESSHITAFPANATTGAVATFMGMFMGAASLTSIGLINTDGSTNITGAFRNFASGARALTTVPAGLMDTHNVAGSRFDGAFVSTNLTLASKMNVLHDWDAMPVLPYANVGQQLMTGGATLDATAQAIVASLTAKGWIGVIQ
jgi:hypothetical protein